MPETEIVIRGAREHNLQNVSLRLPRNQLIVMTGVSGSGKSSLAFDTLYAEGQRRYVESLSSYARQFLGQMPKPEVDSISGLAPSISIQQKTSGRNPRSTVGTITEVYDYLRVLYARVGRGHCPSCQGPITAQTRDQIIDSLLALPAGTRYLVLAPLAQRQKGAYVDLFDSLLKQGFLRARVDGKVVSLSAKLHLDRQMRHTIEVVVDRLQAGAPRPRVAEAVELALRTAGGSLIVSFADDEGGAGRPPAITSTPADAASSVATSHPRRTKASRRKDQGKTPAAPPDDSISPPGAATLALPADDVSPAASDRLFSCQYACTTCGISYEPPSPQLFSFNSPQGMCPDCHGLGVRHDFVLSKLIPDEQLSVKKGAIPVIGTWNELGKVQRRRLQWAALDIEYNVGLPEGAVLRRPWNKVPEEARHAFLYGIDSDGEYAPRSFRRGRQAPFLGIVPELLDSYRTSRNPMRRQQLERLMETATCPTCVGARLNTQARHVRLTTRAGFEVGFSGNGAVGDAPQPKPESKPRKRTRRKVADQVAEVAPAATSSHRLAQCSLGLPEACALTIAEAVEFFSDLELSPGEAHIAAEVLKEIRGRLGFLLRCGLDYLTLDRGAPTLSGGESQRIRLAGQIGCGLVGVVYILDEPSIGLHPRDNEKLLESLLDLRDLGNTVIVVEHDEETIRAADHVIDFGPGPGVRGGEVVAEGRLADLAACSRSITGAYLTGRKQIPLRARRSSPKGQQLKIAGARHNNLRNIDVHIPLGTFVCISGVSGSGKSSLVNDILWEALNRDLNKGIGRPGAFDRLEGLEHLDKAIDIDQSPIGRTPRSNPATYVKLFDHVRDLYTQLPESKRRGYAAGRFSFNVPGGRCEGCEGHGANRLEMDFLAEVWVTCPVCNGRRFNHETLEVQFKGRSIADVLEMDVQQALELFENVPKIQCLLQTLHHVGLDYLKLGQPSPTLSGGEAQRIKLARELGKRSTGRTIYLLDEPTTGLHFADVHKLLDVLHGLVEAGNTVLVVEHNLDVIKTADWVIDLGPEGGHGGGALVVEGSPEAVAECAESHTGRALRRLLGAAPGLGHGQMSERLRHRLATPVEDRPLAGPICIKGAAEHNLQHVDVEVPREKMSVFCGPSGSGKTSLAMDTLYAEGQRRYVESLSSYARQFLGQMPKPKVEHISGLSPAVAIEQKTVGHSPRSTVGTVTEIYDYLRILFARLGQSYCPDCDLPVQTQTTDEVIEKIRAFPPGTRLLVLAPQVVQVGDSYERLWERLRAQGFRRVRVDGTTHVLEAPPELDRRRKHEVEVVIDRVTLTPDGRSRLAESIESALDLARGFVRLAHVHETAPEPEWRIDRYSLHKACGQCGRSFDELTPHHFSFNSPIGWCPACEGLGVQQGTNIEVLIEDPKRTLRQGAIAAWPKPAENAAFAAILHAMSQQLGLPLDIPFQRLDPKYQRWVLFGTGDRPIVVEWPGAEVPGGEVTVRYKGLYPAVDEATRGSPYYRERLGHLIGEVPCSACQGSRLRDDAAAVRFAGHTLQQVCDLPLAESLALLRDARLKPAEHRIAGDLLREVTSRLAFLVDVGLHYLTLARTMPTLSGGESQRIRLAGQVGRALTGVLYVLDEPTIGLHPRDNGRLLAALRQLRDLGNTVVLVEHDREVLAAADRLYDFGPGAGRLGGQIVSQGVPTVVEADPASLTGRYLSGAQAIPIPLHRRFNGSPPADALAADQGRTATSKLRQRAPSSSRARPTPSNSGPMPPGGGWLSVLGARHHNLRDVNLHVPLGTLTCVTGVSGSGKSTLVEETLARAAARRLHGARDAAGAFDHLVGLQLVDKIIRVNQQPLGNTPASNPATYTGVFDVIRELFARLPEARLRGYRAGRFSFNRAGGRCDACEGNGQKCIEMHFLPDVWVECDACRGRRFNAETLAVQYRGNSIADVLEMSIGQAQRLFADVPAIASVLATLAAVGLDYLTLGQSAATLSGGEAQRVKLAAELARPQAGRTLYILDEPTTGLHFDDIRKLLRVLDSLVEKGNTVVVIEHNLDVIKTADWIIDLGPEAGIEGGWIVAQGTPETVVKEALALAAQPGPGDPSSTSDPAPKAAQVAADAPRFRSYTGELLAPVLAAGPRREREVFEPPATTRVKEKSPTFEADEDEDARPLASLFTDEDARPADRQPRAPSPNTPVEMDRLARMLWVLRPTPPEGLRSVVKAAYQLLKEVQGIKIDWSGPDWVLFDRADGRPLARLHIHPKMHVEILFTLPRGFDPAALATWGDVSESLTRVNGEAQFRFRFQSEAELLEDRVAELIDLCSR